MVWLSNEGRPVWMECGNGKESRLGETLGDREKSCSVLGHVDDFSFILTKGSGKSLKIYKLRKYM